MKYIIEIDDKEEQKYVNPISRELMIPKGFGKHEWEGSVNTGIKLTLYDESEAEQRGREEAWGLAQELENMEIEDWRKCFHNIPSYAEGLTNMSFQEACDKYEAWKAKADEIHIGDVVRHDTYGRCVLLEKKNVESAELWAVLDEKGMAHQINKKHITGKTDKHFNEVAKLLEKMKESE